MRLSLAWFETLGQDLRLAVRTLRKSPGFLTVVVLSLAVGIGANSTIFSVIDTLLYRPLSYDHAEQLTAILETQLSLVADLGVQLYAQHHIGELDEDHD